MAAAPLSPPLLPLLLLLLPLLLLLLPRAEAAPTNWCDLASHTTAASFATNLTKALQGKTLRVVAFHEPPWAVVDMSLPAGYGQGKRVSGLEPELMGMIAEEGGFTLDYSGQIVGPNESWTTALLAAKDEYDLVAGGGWMDSSERRHLGVIFSTSISNLGTVLAMRRPEKHTTSVWQNAWFWTKPFTGGAYAVVFVALAVVPALLLWVLERRDQPGVSGIMQGQFMGILAVTGFGDFTWPTRGPSRGVMTVWSIACLVVVSSYTASLTSFLVVSGQPQVGVGSADDFFNQGKVACVPKGWAVVPQIRRRWPKFTSLLREVPAGEMAHVLVEKGCDGMLMQYDYMRILLQGGPPSVPPTDGGEDYGCRCTMVGRTEIQGMGAFPSGNANCKWFVMQVVNGLIRTLSERGAIEELFQRTVSSVTQGPGGHPLCSWVRESQTSRRRLKALGKGGGGKGGGGAAGAVVQEDEGGEIVISAEHMIGLLLISLPAMAAMTAIGHALDMRKRPPPIDALSTPLTGGDGDGTAPAPPQRGLLGGWSYGTKSYRVEEHGDRLYFRQGAQRGELHPANGRGPEGFGAHWRAELGEGTIWLRHDRAKRTVDSAFVHKRTGEVFRNTAHAAVGRIRTASVVR